MRKGGVSEKGFQGRLAGFTKTVGGGCCRLRVPLKLEVAARERATGP